MTEHGTTTDAAGPDPDKAVSNAHGARIVEGADGSRSGLFASQNQEGCTGHGLVDRLKDGRQLKNQVQDRPPRQRSLRPRGDRTL